MKKIVTIILCAISFFIGALSIEIIRDNIEYEKRYTAHTKETTINQERLFDIVQRWRYDNKLQPYTKSDFLCNIATIRLKETGKVWDHNAFDANRFCKGYVCTLGENLSHGFISEENVLEAWLNSPSHKKNLDTNFTHSCLKCENRYCVQIFGNQ